MRLGRLVTALAAALLWAAPLGAQATGTITGRVVQATTQQPQPGATVTIEGMQRSTVTAANGSFQFTGVPAGNQRISATLLGHRPQTQEVTVSAGATATIQFALQPEVIGLQELVVIGYGERQARDVTGAVATVTTEEFNPGRVVSPEELIQAKIPGVQVIDSGEPGGGVNIRIRGATSINASNEPLFVVDGVPLPVGGGLSAGRNPLNFLNPDDVESITVLKDAAATAIYGSRGSNGVVIVQTKAGRTQGPQFNYNGSISTSRITRHPNILSAQEFRQIVAERVPDRVRYLGTSETDWRGAVLRSSAGQEHALAVSGAGDDMNYRLSLGYLGQEGVVRGSMTERVSAALNYNHRLFENRLNVRASLRSARTDDEFTPGGGLGTATIFDPTQPIRTESGFFEQREFNNAPTNPVAELELGLVEGTTFRNIASVEGQYRMPFLEALSATGRLSYDVASSERRTFLPSVMWAQQRAQNPGYVSRSNPRETTGVVDAFLTYASPLAGFQSEVDATAGYSYEAARGDYPFFEARGLSTDLLGPNGVPTAVENVSRLSVRETRLASFFGRVNYTLRDRYILSLSVRRDGSSRFGAQNQWGTFPAAAVAWRVSDEAFMRGMGWLSDLRVRASWGTNGNQAIGDYLWAPDYRYGDSFSQVQFGDEFVTTIRPTAVDPDIKWEETTSYNLGLDYGVFDNRFSGSIEYYFKDTDDLLFRVPVAAGTFVSNFVTTNIGSVRNQGVELSLNALVLDGGAGGLSWNANFNAAANRNRLLQINPFGGGGEQILTGGISGGVGSNIQVLQPGHSINSFFVFRHRYGSDGRPIYSENLLEMYEDLNGDGIINQNDRAPFANPAPDWILGHTSQFGFRNFDMSFTLRAHLGNYVYNNLASQGYFNRLTEAAGPVNVHRSVLETGFVRPQYFSDVYVEDASFLRMDNITLGYRIGSRGPVQLLRIFSTVQNVFTATGYSGVDPEAGLLGIDNNLYPRSRTFTAGVSVGF